MSRLALPGSYFVYGHAASPLSKKREHNGTRGDRVAPGSTRTVQGGMSRGRHTKTTYGWKNKGEKIGPGVPPRSRWDNERVATTPVARPPQRRQDGGPQDEDPTRNPLGAKPLTKHQRRQGRRKQRLRRENHGRVAGLDRGLALGLDVPAERRHKQARPQHHPNIDRHIRRGPARAKHPTHGHHPPARRVVGAHVMRRGEEARGGHPADGQQRLHHNLCGHQWRCPHVFRVLAQPEDVGGEEKGRHHLQAVARQ